MTKLIPSGISSARVLTEINLAWSGVAQYVQIRSGNPFAASRFRVTDDKDWSAAAALSEIILAVGCDGIGG
jgi:hypothetical protein